MIKRGKYFLPPPDDGSDFKELFKRLAAAGAGRPVDKDGIPSGPWTPELLATAISEIDANQTGIELRTVQLWFQDNEKGISSENIRWLAQIFGCNDPDATSDWQAALSSGQSRLSARRRTQRNDAPSQRQHAQEVARDAIKETSAPGRPFSLALRSEALFGGAILNLPSAVFAGAVALGFTSYFLGNYSISYQLRAGPMKEVGFLWAPNWTFLFMLFMPLFFGVVAELLSYWKNEGRPMLIARAGVAYEDVGWPSAVLAVSVTFWVILLICLFFVGAFQWVEVRLFPLLYGDGNFAIDWGSIALKRPDVITPHQAIAFSGFAYLYMCICFYLLFSGFVLLNVVSGDLASIDHAIAAQEESAGPAGHLKVHERTIYAIFRCSVLAILIAMCMKLQSAYLTSSGVNILSWLLTDMFSVFSGDKIELDSGDYVTPNHFSSLIVVLASCFVFGYGAVKIGIRKRWLKMTFAVSFVAVSYLLIGVFPGFSLLLTLAVIIATYGMFDPGFGSRTLESTKDRAHVL